MAETAALPEELIRRLGGVRSVGAITGAGVSSESGIRTYRGEGGLYDDPDEGERTVEALSGPTLLRDPDRTWRVVALLARQVKEARPNAAHQALARIEQKVERFVLLTQNVDRLHHDAGSLNVIDIHGDIFATRCMSCGLPGHLEPEALKRLEQAPRCDRCEGTLRPDAVLFGEMLPQDKLSRINDEFYLRIPDLVLIAGTSALFPYITEPVLVARYSDRLTVEINPEDTALSDRVDFALRGPASHYLPAIEAALLG
jgi:NAD-dependent deacetylase